MFCHIFITDLIFLSLAVFLYNTVSCQLPFEKNPNGCIVKTSQQYLHKIRTIASTYKNRMSYVNQGRRKQHYHLQFPPLQPYTQYDQKCFTPAIKGRLTENVDIKNKFESITIVEIENPPDRLPDYCGGVFISSYWILTSAHCIRTWTDDRVSTPQDRDIMLVHDLYGYPGFNTNDLENDIALMKMSSSEIHEMIPTCAPPPNNSLDAPLTGVQCMATKWKVLYKNYNRWGLLFKDKYKLVHMYVTFEASDDEFLYVSHPTRHTELYLFDGPLMCPFGGKWLVVGIMSNASFRNKFQTYTRISRYLEWIRETMRKADWEQYNSR